ncbi:MAG: hypothetical protein K2M00_02715, partial [Muribaculaceae bacterium]|nr:hypothetical protein [Muribaculaceae bacterium]
MKKRLLFLVAFLAAYTPLHAADYYLIGGFNDWALKQDNCKFTDQGDGSYVLDYEGTLPSGFKINDGTWSNDNANFGGNGNLVLGEVYALVVGGSSGNITLEENIENPHLVFNPEAKTLLITGQGVEATYIYGIHGQIFEGGSDWTSMNMAEADGKWTFTGDMVSGDFGIYQKDADSDAQTKWF